MAQIDIWIQIENHPWDVAVNNIDRMTGETMQAKGDPAPVVKTLTSPETGVARMKTMFKPLSEDALILRRYTANWGAPDDRKVNPWDLNEANPTDAGTMGTIPGPVIECEVGDSVVVHFRNRDHRAGVSVKERAHSLHPHGFAFSAMHDGAYPLSPPDPGQPVGAEAALWSGVGVTVSKKGDRVPPDGTFDYFWNTVGWPTTAGVWLYHDHSICDMTNVNLGAIGIIVIHNPADPDEVIAPPLPGGSPVGSPVTLRCFPFPDKIPALPHDLSDLGHGILEEHHSHPVPGSPDPAPRLAAADPAKRKKAAADEHDEGPDVALSVRRGDVVLEFDKKLAFIRRLCLPNFRDPPDSAQYLLLFHQLGDAGMCINGRKYLGNTPTLVAGANTKMRFGLVGMGGADSFHTFHLHGHRWTVPGPDGTNVGAIQNSVQNTAVSQFEDTRTFGPANSFVFTIDPRSFMRSEPPLGEWHMHCHVLTHMMDGMMGSVLKVAGGSLALGLPRGEPCPMGTGGGGGGGPQTITVKDNEFSPKTAMVSAGDTVIWQWSGSNHSTTADDGSWNSGVHSAPFTFSHTFGAGDSGKTFRYFCQIHGGPGGLGMSGSITVM